MVTKKYLIYLIMIILYLHSGIVSAKYILFCYKGYGTGVDKDRLERMALQNSINSIKKN